MNQVELCFSACAVVRCGNRGCSQRIKWPLCSIGYPHSYSENIYEKGTQLDETRFFDHSSSAHTGFRKESKMLLLTFQCRLVSIALQCHFCMQHESPAERHAGDLQYTTRKMYTAITSKGKQMFQICVCYR